MLSLRIRGCVVLLTLAVGCAAALAEEKNLPPKTSYAWTLDEVMQQIAFAREDSYLQYVVMQLARNANRMNDVAAQFNRPSPNGGEERVDLFGLFSGALAIQESLQMDSMRGQPVGKAAAGGKGQPTKVSDLKGPEVKSHPWSEMLAAQQRRGKKSEATPLALCVPEDQFYLEFRSLTKFLEATESGDLWGTHLVHQATRSSTSQQASERLKRQLAVQTDPLVRPFYDMVVQEVAITGSDLFFREGSDVTLLFQVKQPDVFRLRMDGFLDAAVNSRPDAVRSAGKIDGIDYVSVTTPDRAIHAFSAYPRPGLHVRSNSKPALESVLAAITGKPGAKRLGEATEFQYVRTLMPRGAKEEDGFIYLSDPFIRRLVGPELKLTERRRMLCYNHLRMIGHATMLHRTQFAVQAKSLEELASHGCAPAVFGAEGFACPDGGAYSLSADLATGVCSIHGHADQLVPCREIPVERVTEAEAKEYEDFVAQYSLHWRAYFDPIAMRIQLTPREYRVETIILPLIDNSIYTGMAMSLGGTPEPLDALPIPRRNIFSLALRINKEGLLRRFPIPAVVPPHSQEQKVGHEMVSAFVGRGIGNLVTLNVYDSSPMFDFSFAQFMGDMMGRFRAASSGMNDEIIPISFLIASLNSPVYIAIPVKDAQIVDNFFDELDKELAHLATYIERGWFRMEYDYYKTPLPGKTTPVRCYGLSFGPIKWRVFFARIDQAIYLASKPYILHDLASVAADKTDGGPIAHGMIRIRPDHWKDVLPEYRLGWEENSRIACLKNLGPLSAVARAFGSAASAETIRREADAAYAVHFFCPDGGLYELTSDGKHMACSVHGTSAEPRQPAAPVSESPLGKLLDEFSGATAAITFLEDGLHAVLTIQRK